MSAASLQHQYAKALNRHLKKSNEYFGYLIFKY